MSTASTKVTDRIKKLLELSKSTNEHEAAVAAGHAARLMAEFQIEEADLIAADPQHHQPEPVEEEVIDKDGRRVTWHASLIDGLAEAFGGESVYWGDENGTEYRVIAPASAMSAIRYMYSYLTKEIERLTDDAYAREHAECKRSRVEPPSARSWKASFRVGAAYRIRTRLTEARKSVRIEAEHAGKSSALMVIDRQYELALALQKKKYPSLFKKNGKMKMSAASNAGASSTSGYMAGRAAGDSVNISGGKQLGRGQGALKS